MGMLPPSSNYREYADAANELSASRPQGTAQNALATVPSPPLSPVQQLQAMPADPPKPVSHDVTIVTTKKLAQAKVQGCPPEEFGIERGARNIKDCNYCFHDVVTKTESQLIDEGFEEAQIKQLADYTGNTDIETFARDSVFEHNGSTDSGLNTAARLVRITEHYVRMDYEGTGRACLYMVVTGGDHGEVLRRDGKEVIEPIDVIPFASTTTVPVTHRFFGRSMADLIMPLQREKTALKRGALDGIYLSLNPRVEVAESLAGPNTLDDLLTSRPGGIVRTKAPGGVTWQVVPDVSGITFPMMQYIDAELATRTGLTKQSQGIDANALQNQSATAVAQVFDASQMRVKLIARIMAEGVREIFALLHHTIRSHGQEKQTVRLRNQWTPVDPRNWKTRDDMTINVGLGSGGKAQQFAQTMAIANVQKTMLEGGKSNLVGDAQLYNTAAELTKIMGHKNPDKFFVDPTGKPPAPPPPNPDMIKAQSQAQIEQMKAQRETQQAQIEAQQAADKAKLDAFHAQVKLEGELQLAREKAELEAKLALIDAGLKEKADARAHELHQQKMAHAEQTHGHNMQRAAFDHAAKGEEAKNSAETKTGVHATTQAVTKLHEDLAKHAKALEDAAGAPIEIIRDPKTGKASAIKRGNKTMNVHRGKDGRPEKLQ